MPKFGAGVVTKLAANKIRALKLEGPLGYEQLCQLCEALKQNTSCRKLDLDGCYIGQFCPTESCFDPDRADGLVQILGMLRVNRTIEELDLQNNGLGKAWIRDSLTHTHTTLTHAHITGRCLWLSETTAHLTSPMAPAQTFKWRAASRWSRR